MCSPHDAKALAAMMEKMMALPEVARQPMSLPGRAHIEANYSLDRVVDQREALYKNLVKRKGIVMYNEK